MRSHRPGPALIVAVVALVVALCGTTVAGYAAGKASGDSVIKKKSLSGNRLKPDSVQGKQVAEATLGKVPSAGRADTATTATTAAMATTAGHAATADQTPGGALVQPSVFGAGWDTSAIFPHRLTGLRKDASGYVHLQGAVERISGSATLIVTLPAGHRPAADVFFPVYTAGANVGSVSIGASGAVTFISGSPTFVSLEGISFHADQ
jgi:hypothetical protein